MDVSKNQPQPSHGQNKAFCKFVLGAVGSCTRPSRNVSCMKFDFGAMCAVCNCIKKEIAAIYTPGYTWINTYIYIWYHIYDISYIYHNIYIYTSNVHLFSGTCIFLVMAVPYVWSVFLVFLKCCFIVAIVFHAVSITAQ
jgi:hypothetical protein